MRFLNACDFFDEVVKATSAREHDVLILSTYTVKKAVELLDVPSKITFLKSNKYNSKV